MSDVKIFAKTIDPEAVNQVYTIAKHPVFENSPIRIMPDAHAGKGCVIGFTAKPMNGAVIPSLVGVDIACGMLTARLHPNTVISTEVLGQLDDVIRKFVPAGRNVHNEELPFSELKQLRCYDQLKNKSHILRSIGTLGGGNHFIELSRDNEGNYYLIIHTGSRNLGKQVCEIYQQKAYDQRFGNALRDEINELIYELKAEGKESHIEAEIKSLKSAFKARYASMPKDLCHLSGQDAEDYLHDALICNEYANKNRNQILAAIVNHMRWNLADKSPIMPSLFTTLHNYVDEEGFIRKGAIYAGKGRQVLIPLNMRDGSLLCVGKGNQDWNESAPHGAGRLYSRSAAKERITLDEYQESMKGIFTTSVCQGTIDESPFAYKNADEIKEAISDTVDIIAHLKPVYNFKASE